MLFKGGLTATGIFLLTQFLRQITYGNPGPIRIATGI